MSKIISIDDCVFTIEEKDSVKKTGYTRKTTYDGWIIKTESETIKVGIDNEPSCCEEWGHVTTMDSPDEFIGAHLYGIKITDTKLKEVPLPKSMDNGFGVMFVTFSTSKGDFQLVTYNDHNGYYGHESVVVSRDLVHSEIL